ncbi:hypothetical protein SPI_02664 [Niveomyces insectorum RCEF 264]|uniref:C6 zinc finger domain containing protein n=1 Tax=Niveomyces insectorum RCEF 264 TaxID=1081102 RepID=A0A167Y5U2_9HYPO|nr:hypothetical protein SPI_02664 [Niveomyces insectorum RCEF 264]
MQHPLCARYYWEMVAFHHFAVATSHTLPGCHLPALHACWSVHAPRLALDDEPLFNQLVALACLHLMVTERDHHDILGLAACREVYLDAALRVHRETLGQLGCAHNRRTADAVSLTSILLIVDIVAGMQTRQLASDTNEYEPPVQWLRMVRGTRSVVLAACAQGASDEDNNGTDDAHSHLKTTTTMTVISTIKKSALYFADPVNFVTEDNLNQFRYLLPADDDNDDHRDGDGDDNDDDDDDAMGETKEAYRVTVAYVGAMRTAAEEANAPGGQPVLALCRRVMAFASVVPGRFAELVEQRAPRALVILAHFFALAAPAREVWWVGGMPVREVEAIYAHISPAMRPLMAWPLQAIASCKANREM